MPDLVTLRRLLPLLLLALWLAAPASASDYVNVCRSANGDDEIADETLRRFDPHVTHPPLPYHPEAEGEKRRLPVGRAPRLGLRLGWGRPVSLVRRPTWRAMVAPGEARVDTAPARRTRAQGCGQPQGRL